MTNKMKAIALSSGSPTVLFICMLGTGHVQRILPVVHEFCKRHYNVPVLAHLTHQKMIENAGGNFIDLFTICPIDAADDKSIPVPIRYVSYAAYYYEIIKEMVATIDPVLIIYDSFTVVAPLIAIELDILYINICSGHNRPADVIRQNISCRPGMNISRSCEVAIQRFNQKYKHVELDPYSFASTQSPYLNLYCEPPQFLHKEERKAFEPLVFLGSINPGRSNHADQPHAYFSRQVSRKVYVSFGTVIWRYYRQKALKAMSAFACYFEDKVDVEIIFSMGGADLKPSEYNGIQLADHISIKSYVDQWSILKEADLFITHHGLNSTHEAIFHEVPMLSHPFYYDQPALAKRCQEYGLAVPLIENTSEVLGEEAIIKAFDSYYIRRDEIKSSLHKARGWELDVISNRGAIVDTIEGEIIKYNPD